MRLNLCLCITALLLAIGGVSVYAEEDAITAGKKIVYDRKKGNCLACHAMEGAKFPGNIGPPLIAMKARFPSKTQMREIIWDARSRNPHTIMPPYGKFRILSEDEIDKVVEYIYTL